MRTDLSNKGFLLALPTRPAGIGSICVTRIRLQVSGRVGVSDVRVAVGYRRVLKMLSLRQWFGQHQLR